MHRDDESYYRARALQERIAARNALCEPARERHEQLAAMYRLRVAMLSSGPEHWAAALQDETPAETV